MQQTASVMQTSPELFFLASKDKLRWERRFAGLLLPLQSSLFLFQDWGTSLGLWQSHPETPMLASILPATALDSIAL